MEDGLRVHCLCTSTSCIKCLNPCFNGRWSASRLTWIEHYWRSEVLILVLMEDGLREIANFPKDAKKIVLILVLMEDGLREDIILGA